MDHLLALWAQVSLALRSIVTPRSVRDIESAPERVTEGTPDPPPAEVLGDGEALAEMRRRLDRIEAATARERAQLIRLREIEERLRVRSQKEH